MDEDSGADDAAEADSRHRVSRAAVRQHVVHGHRADYPRLPAIHRRVGRGRPGRVFRESEATKRLAATDDAPPPRPPRSRLSHRRPVRVESHRSADGESILRRHHRQNRLRHPHDDRADYHVPVHVAVRVRAKLLAAVLREIAARRRLCVR